MGWEWEDGASPGSGTWKAYELEAALRLDNALLQARSEQSLRLGHSEYVVDLSDVSNMTQTKQSTGYRRAVRCPRYLTESQSAALRRTMESSERFSRSAKGGLRDLFRQHLRRSFSDDDVNAVLKFVGQKASVHVNVDLSKSFAGTPLLGLFVNDADGRYRTQFETGTSGGSKNLVRRRGWERRMFGDVYDNKDTERPVYGNLNLVPHRSGDRSARQYGGSYMVLKEPVRKRCTSAPWTKAAKQCSSAVATQMKARKAPLFARSTPC